MKFLFCSKDAKRGKACRFINFFSLLALVFNMSLTGVFFVTQPQVQAASANLCSTDVDVVMVMDRSGSMADGGSPSKCEWTEIKFNGSIWTFFLNTKYNIDKNWCINVHDDFDESISWGTSKAPTYTYKVNSKIEDAVAAATSSLEKFGINDQSALVSFADDANTDKLLSSDHSITQSKVIELLSKTGGGTNIGDAIDLANNELNSGNPQANKVMILLTDGKANLPTTVPDPEQYAKDMASISKTFGYKIFTIGLGGDVKEKMLKNIATTTSAEYYFAPDSSDLEDIYNQISTRICQSSSISGYKYIDPDGLGDISSKVPGAGWEIVLGGDATRTQFTDSNGYYSFVLPPGNYTVSETASNTYKQTFPVDKTYDINLGTEDNRTEINFGNYLIPTTPTGTIRGCKWLDANRDGIWQATSTVNPELPMLPGWKIKLKEINTLAEYDTLTVATNTPTIGEGCYEFTDVPLGDYYISEELQSGWVQTFPGTSTLPAYTHQVKLSTSTLILTNMDFGNYEIICGDKIIDSPETCDDGNTDNSDGCSATCAIEGTQGEYCGDGTVNQTSEQCDDGNNTNGDGCSATCTTESGGSNPSSSPYCGDGSVNQTNEQCDDGNRDNNDGCNSECQSEGGIPLCILTGTCGGATLLSSSPFENSAPQVLGESGTPNLSVTKSVGVDFANPGDTDIAYSVVITNNGNLTSFNTILNDVLPVGLKYGDGGGVTRNWVVGDIEPGASITVKYSVDVAEFAQPLVYTNIATVSSLNHDSVIATADLEVRAIAVLAETGFDGNEYLALTAVLAILISYIVVLRRKYSSEKA